MTVIARKNRKGYRRVCVVCDERDQLNSSPKTVTKTSDPTSSNGVRRSRSESGPQGGPGEPGSYYLPGIVYGREGGKPRKELGGDSGRSSILGVDSFHRLCQ